MAQIGELVTPYLLSPDPWAKRHVETIEFRSTVLARRQLTVDIVLPHERSRSLPWSDGERLFYLPVTTVAKDLPAYNLDLTREDGRTLPILSSEENGEISAIALEAAAGEMLGDLSPELRYALRTLCRAGVRDAEVPMAVALVRIRLEHPRFALVGSHLEALIKELYANWIVWVGLIGRAGERRVLKHSSDLDVEALPIPAKRPRVEWRQAVIPELDEIFHYPAEIPGDGNERGTLRRIAGRTAVALGVVPYDVDFAGPAIRHTETYHLQVPAPEGIETRHVRLRAVLHDDGRPKRPEHHVTPTYAHLYFSNRRVVRMGTVGVSIRIGHRGFLAHSLLACGLIALMLWLFWRAAADAVPMDAEVAVPVLLLVPALLAIFVVRPGEHAIATRLFSGPRMLVFLCGIFSAVNTFTLVRIAPFGIDQHDLWLTTAIGASAVTGVILIAWTLALGPVEQLRRRVRRLWGSYARYMVSAYILILLVNFYVLGLVLFILDPELDVVHVAAAAILLILGLVCAWSALFASESLQLLYSSLVGACLTLTAIAALAGAPFVAGLRIGPASWQSVQLGLQAALVLALLGIPLIEARRGRQEGKQDSAPLEGTP